MNVIKIDYSADKPIISTHNAGEIGENRAVILKVIPPVETGVAMYTMYFAVEGGILPSAVFDVDDDIEIKLTSELTQADILPCQLVGISADGESVITKTPIIELHLGESITGDVIEDPETGDTIFDEIAELKEIADTLDLTQYYKKTETYSKTEVDTKLGTKADANLVYSKNDIDTKMLTKANVSSVYDKQAVDVLLSHKADVGRVTALEALTEINRKNIEKKADIVHYHDDRYYTQTKVDEKLDYKANVTDLNRKANVGASYTKSESDTMLATKANVSSVPTKVSQLTNDKNYVMNSALSRVATTGDYSDLNSKPTKLSQFENDLPVTTLPVASETTLGGIKVGNNLTIDSNAYLDAVIPTASASVLGGIKVGENLTITADGVLNAQAGGGDCKVFEATSTTAYSDIVSKFDSGYVVIYRANGYTYFANRKLSTGTIFFVAPYTGYNNVRNADGDNVIGYNSISTVTCTSNGFTDPKSLTQVNKDNFIGYEEATQYFDEEIDLPDNRLFTASAVDNYYVRANDISTVATSGSYNDLSNKPTIPTVDEALADSPNAISNSAVNTAIGDIESLLEAML